MTKLSALALAAGLAVSGAALAHAGSAVPGKWTYQVGATGTPCALTFTAGRSERSGDISSADCNKGLYTVASWRTMGTSLQLMSPSGDLVAVLRPKGDGYAGKQFNGGRKITLSH